MVKLMNCAHCGSDGVRLIRTIEDDTVYWHVECPDCGISTAKYPENNSDTMHVHDEEYARMVMDEAIDCAVTIWNSRVNVPCDACEKLPPMIDKDTPNDKIVATAKACMDTLAKRAEDLMGRIKKAMEEEE